MSEFEGIHGILWDMINPIEAIIIMRFIAFNVGKRDEQKGNKIAFALLLAAWDAVIVINGFIAPYTPFSLVCNVIFVVIYGKKYLKGSAFKHIFWYMVAIIILTIIDGLVPFIYSLYRREYDIFEQVMTNFEIRMSLTLIAITLFICITEVYYKIVGDRSNHRNTQITPELVLFVVCAVTISIALDYNIMYVSKDAHALGHLIVYALFYIILLIVAQYYLRNIREKTREQKELQLILLEDEKRKQYYEDDLKVYEKMRRERHDAKHHLMYLDYLEKQHKYLEMKQYIDQIEEK